jgi:parallel beta-helix repeat protein
MNRIENLEGILAIAISLVMLAVAVGSASAGCIGVDTGSDYQCGDTVVESCIFNENLVCPAGVHGLIVGESDITLDGNEYAIIGIENAVVCQCEDEAAPEEADCGIYNPGYDNVVIKNLEVENFCHGILLKGTAENKVVNNTLNSCKVHDNGNESTDCFTHGILLIYTINSTVDNNEVYNNTGEVTTACSTGGHGIKLFTFSNYNNITNNTIYGNAVAGIYAKKECTYNYAAYNELYENGKFVGGPAEIGCVAHDGTVYKCGDMVVQSCTFNGDMSCPSGHGLEIGEDGIVIDGYNETDGKYYWIDGGSPISHVWSGIYDYLHDNIVIKNLEIKHFRNGIYLKGSVDDEDRVENVTIENCTIHDIGTGPTQGINLHYVCNSTIKGCEIYNITGTGTGCEAGGDGIFLYDGSNNTFIYNNIYHNRKAGILIKMKPAFNNISYNELWENGQLHAGTTGGIVLRCKLCNHCIIEHNEVRGNLENGICIGGPDNIIRYNNVTQTKYDPSLTRSGGIVMYRSDGAYRNEVYDNNVTGNEQDGIGIRGGCVDTYLHDNRVCENGIVEPSGYDIWSLYEPSTYGDENTCNTTENYDDAGTTGCTYPCTPLSLGKRRKVNVDGSVKMAGVTTLWYGYTFSFLQKENLC